MCLHFLWIFNNVHVFSSVHFSRSVVSKSLWPHELQHTRPPCASPTPKLLSIKSVMPTSHLILCRPLLLLPPIPPSIRVFSNESTLRMRWPKCYSYTIKNSILGLPWWSSGLDFALQCRGYRFNPWSGSSDPTGLKAIT